jgi:hypothetical protein
MCDAAPQADAKNGPIYVFLRIANLPRDARFGDVSDGTDFLIEFEWGSQPSTIGHGLGVVGVPETLSLVVGREWNTELPLGKHR